MDDDGLFIFAHMETYALEASRQKGPKPRENRADPTADDRQGSSRVEEQSKWSVSQILAEAQRVPGAIPHIVAPKPPRLLYGETPMEVLDALLADLDSRRDPLGRRLRRDRHVLATTVLSYPTPWEMITSDEGLSRLESWFVQTINWVRLVIERDGGELRCVVSHSDETFPHLHCYSLPRGCESYGALWLHPGQRAAAAAERAGEPPGKQRRAYVEAMKAWQDEYWSAVGIKFGFSRLGPARARQSRIAVKVEKELRASYERVMRDLDRRDVELTTREAAEALSRRLLEEEELRHAKSVASFWDCLQRWGAGEIQVVDDRVELDGLCEDSTRALHGSIADAGPQLPSFLSSLDRLVRGEVEKRVKPLGAGLERLQEELRVRGAEVWERERRVARLDEAARSKAEELRLAELVWKQRRASQEAHFDAILALIRGVANAEIELVDGKVVEVAGANGPGRALEELTCAAGPQGLALVEALSAAVQRAIEKKVTPQAIAAEVREKVTTSMIEGERSKRLAALDAGLKAFADGRITGAVRGPEDPRLTMNTSDEASKAELVRGISPAWDLIWRVVKTAQEAVEAKITRVEIDRAAERMVTEADLEAAIDRKVDHRVVERLAEQAAPVTEMVRASAELAENWGVLKGFVDELNARGLENILAARRAVERGMKSEGRS